jgi:3-oxoacyl-[acyl-carrier protein] reductase
MCAYRAAQVMREAGGGNIIHISSVGGLRAHWIGLPYDATKGAIDAMTRTMALDLAEYGIRVNAVAPGATLTERIAIREPSRMQRYVERVPLKRIGLPLEMGATVAFLASPDADYITGQVIYVDGGITIQLGTREQPT